MTRTEYQLFSQRGIRGAFVGAMAFLLPAITVTVLTAAESTTRPVMGTARSHWAFQPIQRPIPPSVSSTGANPIDQFIIAKLQSTGLNFSPPANKPALI